ncbi:MAG: hypothetical protein CMJ78_18385 [Planctomycetaceae bacterium]|nr:hypothetical protein [Planctomycetaceae bacterium]
MAKCDEGYLCDICQQPVDEIVDSDLYLRYILGEVSWEQLNTAAERHIRCNPVQAQFIVDDDFDPVEVEGDFDKRNFAPEDRKNIEDRVTRAWRRLQEVAKLGIPINEYPLDS